MADTTGDLAQVRALLDELRSEVVGLRSRVGDLEVENAELRASPSMRPQSRPSDTESSDTETSDIEPTPSAFGRRRLLVGGATAGAAAVAGVIATAQPAAAANGGNLVLGQANDATAETKIAYGGTGNNGFRVEGGSTLAMIEAYQTGSAPGVKGANTAAGTGVEGLATTGSGVRGQVSGTGGIGVEGVSPTGIGVLGTTTGGNGVKGTSSATFSTGVFGISDGVGGCGLQGRASGVNASAVIGIASGPGGVGVFAASDFAQMRLDPRIDSGVPTADEQFHAPGDIVFDVSNDLWVCIAAGTPGTWRKLAGPGTAGALHVLPAPARVYDSRPNTAPLGIGPKTPFGNSTVRTFDLTVNGSGVPADATAALVTVLLVNAANAAGNATIWANGVPKPAANSLVWGGAAGRFTVTATTALGAGAKIQFQTSHPTDLVLDVVAYYR